MENSKELTAGQKAVVDGYLANNEPAETFDPKTCTLVDTQTMINELSAMCFLDENQLCNYLAQKGYRSHFVARDAIIGWILKDKDKHHD